MRSLVRSLAVLIATLLVLGISGFGQSATTSLRGTIADTKGAVVSGAKVTLNNKSTGFARTVTTDDQGAYQFLEVPPSTYVLTATAAGFSTTKRENVVLQVSSPATMNLSLEVQGTSVVVDVTGEAPVVNTQDASQGHVFGANQLIELPSEGRDPVSILSLQPGVTFIGNNTDTSNDSRGGAVSGARSDQTNVTWDGLDNNDQLNGFAFQGALRATLDSLQEFRVTTTNSNADSGRSSGAQVNLVTKSGTNNFHGSLYEYNRNAFTAANDWFNKQAQLRQGLPNQPGQLIRNTFGASIGGPIKKDRIFFFATYEGQRTRETDQVTRTIPSNNLRNGIISYKCDQTDPACAAGQPGISQAVDGSLVMTLTPTQFAQMDLNAAGNGQCPWATANGCGADPNALNVFKTYPQPNTDAAGDGLDYRGYTFAGLHPKKLDTYIVKLDFNLDTQGKNTIFMRGNLQNDREALPPQFNQPVAQPPTDVLTNNSKGIAVGYTALLAGNKINNFRYAFIRQGLGDRGLSSSNVADFRGLTDPVSFSSTILTNVPVHNFADDFTWTRGKHTIQFGTNQRFISNNRQSNAQNFSTAQTNVYWLGPGGIANTGTSLDPAASGFGLPAVDSAFATDYDFAAAAMAGLLSEVNSVFNQDKHGVLATPGTLIQRHFKNWEGEMYVQDAWRVKPNLTLTAGLRYSLLQTPYETNGEQAAPSVSMHDWFATRAKDMLQGIPYHPELSFNLSGKANNGKPYWNWDYKDFAPRLAFAYSPNFDHGFMHSLFGATGKSSIRGGYGIYFDHFGQGIVNSFDRQGSFGLTTAITNPASFQDVDTTARFTSLTSIPTTSAAAGCPSLVPSFKPGFPFTPPNDPCFGFAIAWGLDDKLKTPYSHVLDLSITRELSNGLVIEAAYIGRLGRRLLQEADLAMPVDLVDPTSKTDYFSAATMLSKAAIAGTDINSLPKIPYWEDMFPAAAGQLGFGAPGDPANLGCAPGDDPNGNYSATQAMYDMYSCYTGNETVALFNADLFCLPACSAANSGQPFAYWDDQFSSLYSWRTQGNSSYHALQLTLRRPMSKGLQFDFNYTFSKSIDVGSNAERVNGFETTFGGFSDQVINSWSPNQLRAVSDFDTKHQINANWVWEIPVGRGHRFGGGMGRIADAVLGGWGLSGLVHWTSGLPFSVVAGAGWATNWEWEGLAVKNGNPGKVGVYRDANNDPNMFPNVNTAIGGFRDPFPGESGQRNALRGPGFFGIDSSLGKSWAITERQKFELRWDVFNITNSVRFDAAGSAVNEALTDSGSFGKYQGTLTKPRVMQLSARYTF